VFGDAQWTNKDRLPDQMLRDLIEHFSSQTLSIANCPEDELGIGYEFLIKKFADDSGHTAAEFYTNRTVVHLMTEMLDPKPGESIYDPTCGSAGMLLSAVAHLKRQDKEWRNLKLYGQERKPADLGHRPDEPVPAWDRRFQNRSGRYPGASRLCRR
jgi:type I restriction enzyme M protein